MFRRLIDTTQRICQTTHLHFANLAAATICCLLVCTSAASAQTAIKNTHPKAKDAAITQRANALLAQMTLQEKIGQLNQHFLFLFSMPPSLEDEVAQGRYGSFLFVTDPAVINRLQHAAMEKSRLHIPLLFGFDVIHGYRTIFPTPLAMAASFDPEVARRASEIAAAEASSVGIRWVFAPMVDIARDARWGRIVEGAGEDPYLGSAMARAQVQGFQGSDLSRPDHVMACLKHFAAYGAAEGGRDYDAVYLPEEVLRNVYFPPFAAGVDAGAGSVMSAYHDLNDVPATGNQWLLQDILRGEMGFNGFVVSDANAIGSLVAHGFAHDEEDAAYRAMMSGVDMDMDSKAYPHRLEALLKSGRITESQLDNAVRAVLEAKLKLGLFEHPYVDEARVQATLSDPAHREQARIAAERSAVLLRNEHDLLPLSNGAYKKIAVLGPLADNGGDTLGPWSFTGEPKDAVTILAGLKAKAAQGVTVEFAQGVQIKRLHPSFTDMLVKGSQQKAWTQEEQEAEFNKAVQLARNSDLTVIVLGEKANMSGESASKSSLDMTGRQQELLEAVVKTGKPVVLLLMNSRPVNITWAAEHVDAILELWHPGSEGGAAAANLLFGAAVPSGKLPVTWPRSTGQEPLYYAHNLTQDTKNQHLRYFDVEGSPLYPFGYGLSYTRFAYTNLKVQSSSATLAAPADVTVDVENTGDVAGEAVVQLYMHQQYGSASRPVRELKGFARVKLAAHEKKTIHFALGAKELEYWSSSLHRTVLEASTYDLWVGGDSNATLHTTLEVAATK